MTAEPTNPRDFKSIAIDLRDAITGIEDAHALAEALTNSPLDIQSRALVPLHTALGAAIDELMALIAELDGGGEATVTAR